MSDEQLPGGPTLSQEIQQLRADIDTRLGDFKSLLSSGLDSIKELFRNVIATNDKAHEELRSDYKEIKKGMKDIYERINKDKDDADKKISAVRVDLETKIGDVSQEVEGLKLAPGEKAAETLTKIGRHALTAIISIAIMALVWWISQGAPATNIPMP